MSTPRQSNTSAREHRDVRQAFLVVGILFAIALIATYFVLTNTLLSGEEVTDQRRDSVVINMSTRSWRFDPEIVSGGEIASASSSTPTGAFADTTIKVKRGSRVEIRITNLDPNQPHGFGLEEFGVQSVTNPPQQTVEVRFVANKEGSFTFFCTVFCGTGHPRHKGILIVEG